MGNMPPSFLRDQCFNSFKFVIGQPVEEPRGGWGSMGNMPPVFSKIGVLSRLNSM